MAMKYKFDGFNYIVRLEKGEELISTLAKLIQDKDIPSCWISGLGACSKAELGFYDIDKKEYNWKMFDEPMEILGLSGDISWLEGEPNLHIHGSFSKRDFSSVGGHVKELIVNGTCEIFLHKWDSDKLTRSKDNDVGLNLLDL